MANQNKTKASSTAATTVRGHAGALLGDRLSLYKLLLFIAVTLTSAFITLRSINTYGSFMSSLLLFTFASGLVILFAHTFLNKLAPSFREYCLMSALLVISLLIMRGILLFVDEIGNTFPTIPSLAFHYMLPFAASTIVAKMVLRPLAVVLFAFVHTFFVGVLFDYNFLITLYAFLSSLYGAYAIARCQTRSTLFLASFYVALFNLLLVAIIEITIKSTMGYQEVIYTLLFTSLSAIFIFFFISLATIVVEGFDFVTDMKLIELANFNNPLLNRLALEAPGTYHHSRVVAQMVEAAAQSVGANPLLAMVCALYHDIGKTKAPQYFVENQGPNDKNVHDKLKPSMSKMIVISHVKDGVEMAKKAGLPKAIVDGIPEHHGTSLISFFYSKAKKMEDPDVDTIDESEYRYPGPKPQSKETALLLLADSVEATAKSLPEPTSGRIQQVIDKTFNKYFIDGQLDECDLTLKDLNFIAKSFHRTLASVYKPRVEYPDSPHRNNNKKVKNQDASRTQQHEENTEHSTDDASAKDGDDLKRLGM